MSDCCDGAPGGAAGEKLGRSGQAILTPGYGGTDLVPAKFKTVCRILGDVPMVRTLRISLSSPDLLVFGESVGTNQLFGFLGGDPSGYGPPEGIEPGSQSQLQDAGLIRIRLGDNAQRTILADLQSGEYILPPHTSVYVDVTRWTPLEGAPLPPFTAIVTAEIVDGDCSDFRPLTLTGYGLVGEGDGANMRIPAGAYAFELQTSAGASWSFLDGNGPVFECVGSTYALRDYVDNVQIPPATPIPISGSAAIGDETGDQSFNITTYQRAAGGPFILKTMFYVR